MKKMLSIMLVVMMVFGLVACGGGESSSVSPAGSTSTPSFTLPSSSEIEEDIKVNQQFLTGLPKDENYSEGQRMVAIMINNIAQARPQKGISEAEILVEAVTEGGITRFMALFQDYKDVPVTGPIRSARDQFFQLILPFWAFYIHDGQSGPTGTMFQQYEYAEFDMSTGKYGSSSRDPNNLSSLAWRDQNRLSQGYAQEHTEYTAGANIAATIEANELDSYRSYSPMFNFVSYKEEPRVPNGGKAEEVTVVHTPRQYMSYFKYDAAAGRYMMSMYNMNRGSVETTIDENDNSQVGFENLLVLFTPMGMYPSTYLPKYDYAAGGYGYLFTQGAYQIIRWEKGAPNYPLFLFDLDGNDLYLNTGHTYIGIVNENQKDDFEASVQSGNADDVITSGDVDPNQTDPTDEDV